MEKCEVRTFQRRAGHPHRAPRKDFPSLGRKVSQYNTKSFHFWRPLIFAKMHFFVFYRNFGFNLEKSSNHYSQLKKHLKVDPETRSYDFLTKTHEKNPMCRNILISYITLENALITMVLPWYYHDIWYSITTVKMKHNGCIILPGVFPF